MAARLAIERRIASGLASRAAILSPIAAISVGIVDGQCVLDLDYPLDSAADVDFNVVMNGSCNLIEVQGTAEGEAFSRAELNQLLDYADQGIQTLLAKQEEAVAAGLANRPNAG